MLRKSRVIDTDYYKTTMGRMYSPDVEGIFSYAESRGGAYAIGIMFGLQGFIKEKLLTPVTKEDVDYADKIISAMGVKFDRTAWDIVVDEYNGYLPFTIKAVPEGLKVPVRNAVVTVECTDKRLISLVGYLETALLRAVWYPATIASRAYSIRQKIENRWKLYATSGLSFDFAFLDFSARGVESQDASEVATAAFLTSFMGTDTIAGVAYLYDLYGGGIHGYSVAATEHSVMCSWEEINEEKSFGQILEDTPDGSILSVVSDTWNIFRACEYWNKLAGRVKEKNINMVVRPDSGDPLEVIPKMIDILEQAYPYHINDKGMKVFDYLKILWGDGIDENNFLPIYDMLIAKGWSPEILILGSGGGLMQKVDRDTMKWAFKASAVYKNGQWKGIKKDPITDKGKTSKSGKLELVFHKKRKEYGTEDWSIAGQLGTKILKTVYEYEYGHSGGRGVLRNEQNFNEIKELVRA